MKIGRNDEDRKFGVKSLVTRRRFFVSLTLRPIFIVEKLCDVPISPILSSVMAVAYLKNEPPPYYKSLQVMWSASKQSDGRFHLITYLTNSPLEVVNLHLAIATVSLSMLRR